MFEVAKATRAVMELTSKNADKRRKAAVTLARIGKALAKRDSNAAREAADALVVPLTDSDRSVAKAAIAALGQIGWEPQPAVLTPLLILSTRSQDATVADAAAQALVAMEPGGDVFLQQYFRVTQGRADLNDQWRKGLAPLLARCITSHIGQGLAGTGGSYSPQALIDELCCFGRHAVPSLQEILASHELYESPQVVWARACLACLGVDTASNIAELRRLKTAPDECADLRRAFIRLTAAQANVSGQTVDPGRFEAMSSARNAHAAEALREISSRRMSDRSNSAGGHRTWEILERPTGSLQATDSETKPDTRSPSPAPDLAAQQSANPAMTTVTAVCPNRACARKLRAPAKHGGRRAKCPCCGTALTIPERPVAE